MKRLINLAVRSSICNFRCSYCYLNQKSTWFRNTQICYSYPPEVIKKAFSIERLGGPCLFNVCSDGETLLADKIVEYLKAILEAGHCIEFVSNMTITKVLDEILSLDKQLLKRISFKCSFHYLELKTKGLLETFSSNVNKAKNNGCSFSIEMIPDDSYIPHINDIKTFCLSHFGALPHLSIPRNDKKGHKLLSNLSFDEFKKTWSDFDSDFFNFKLIIYRKKIRDYCFAGRASLYVDLATGHTQQCYKESGYSFNIFENIDRPIPFCSIGKCNDCYCYNGHALLPIGCVKKYKNYKYGNLRDRVCNDGTHWVQKDMLIFLNEKSTFEETKGTISNDRRIMSKVRLKYFKKKIANKLKIRK